MKTFLYKVTASVLLIMSIPFLVLCYVMIKSTSKGPFLFRQVRLGMGKKPFIIYKLRTMVDGAEKLKNKYRMQNEADGPVFKIHNDPRYTEIGSFFAHTGLDELPQLINIIRGEMTFVGPRPLPVNEALNIPIQYLERFNVLPGITSLWFIYGSHKLSFKEWMELDIVYVKNSSIFTDIKVLLLTIEVFINIFYKKVSGK